MKFFVPGAESPSSAEEIWSDAKARVEEDFGAVRGRRVFRLDFRHEAKDLVAEVGQVSPELGQTVVAIFSSRDMNYVCTATGGVDDGRPRLVGRHETYEVEYFE
jgi:hypothetical protein